MITPLQDYIVVKPVQRLRSSVLTIITAETDQGSWGAYADVVAVGPGKPNKKGNIMPMDAKPGYRVMYGGERLDCIKFPKVVEDGVEYLLIQEADICFVEEPFVSYQDAILTCTKDELERLEKALDDHDKEKMGRSIEA